MNWLHEIWFGYFVPSLYGNGPESLCEIIIGVVVWNKLLGPRLKKWHQREMERHHAAMRDHVAGEIAKLSAPKTRTRNSVST